MDKREFVKARLLDFVLIQAGITLSMGVMSLFSPFETVSKYTLFMPFVYAFFCTLPGCVTYSKRELTIRQMAWRRVLEFLLILLSALTIAYLTGVLINRFMVIAIALSVVAVYCAVVLIDYLIARAAANAMTQKLRALQQGRDDA